MSKLNIFKTEWIDLVFEGRNKKYGAYQLRSENPKTTTIAVLLGILFFVIAAASPIIYTKIANLTPKSKEKEEEQIIEVVDIQEPPVEVLPPPPPPIETYEAPKSIVEEVKFKPLEAAKKEEIHEDPPKQEDFKNANSGAENKAASETGDINIGIASGTADKGAEAPDDAVYSSAGLQVQPEFPGGIAAFYGYVSKNFRTPELDNDMTAKIFVSFVVEKDGTLTAIKILRDPGYGMGKEAERVLKSLKVKWSPGIQNGKPVRASYTLPITINIKSS